ncbi:hypothetical protein DL766_004629 [Monosporascus sp. MC13-8B]|uniref:2EXR domain-containing protein n=1 Tax=Monosporascus cannonballus TaxID=155416 RepID=A0ABY0HE83_9PEZI|nr:hypothetical protein DL763_007038 [Monosporascus cannonballus]RYO91467.1 hypothetical protein DL762_002193 [Monosporascus cannonballus]RYP30910.1 hypothetical protein DL766_004629 [Monosporascus sp. MC13-8B]
MAEDTVIPRGRRQSAENLGKKFVHFAQLPAEIRLMIWNIASHEYGYLQVIPWGHDNTPDWSSHKSFGPFPNNDGYCSSGKRRQASPLLLVSHEAHAAAASQQLEHLQIARPHQEDVLVPVSHSSDMFYFPGPLTLPALFGAILNLSYADKLERLAVTICGSTARDKAYLDEDRFENAIRGLPKLRQLFLVVDHLFSVEGFGPGLVRHAALPEGCPDHVRSRTALRKHIADQHDDGFGFSDYEKFTRRWQWPARLRSPTRWFGELAPFREFDPYCKHAADRVTQIADKLQRDIDVKLVIDLDRHAYRVPPRPMYQGPPLIREPWEYEGSDINFRRTHITPWYDWIRQW